MSEISKDEYKQALGELLEQAQSISMTPEQERTQRISFVYGNTHIENDRITRELVESVDAAFITKT